MKNPMSIWFSGRWVGNLLFVPKVFFIPFSFLPFIYLVTQWAFSLWQLQPFFSSRKFPWIIFLIVKAPLFFLPLSGFPLRCIMTLLDLSSVFLLVPTSTPYFKIMLYSLGSFHNFTFILVSFFGSVLIFFSIMRTP